MKKYDFILFEHTTVINHQHDLEEIAKLLQCQGKRVAIAEVYNEHEYCKDASIEHYVFKKPFQEIFATPSDVKFAPFRFVANRIKLRKFHNFLEYALCELSEITSNIYVGSFFNICTYSWLKNVPKGINIYVWGLRSFWQYEYKIAPFSIPGIYSYLNRNLLSKYRYLKLFVSNEIIRDEYKALGVSEDRLVIRPERTINSIVQPKSNDNGRLRLLTIGSLRPDKRIEITAEALSVIKDNEIDFVIAGSTQHNPEYEKVIRHSIERLNHVKRLNSRLCDEEYNQLIEDCDFLVLCDIQHPSSVTNGTLDEALLKGKPIIAPNYNPYKYIIEKYKVGILFDPSSIDSLVSAILQAKRLGAESYSEQIINYQKTLLIENVSRNFVNEIGL